MRRCGVRSAFVPRRRRCSAPQMVRRRDVGVCAGCEMCCCVAEQPSNARGGRLERRWTYCFRARKPCRGARKGRPRVVQCARRARTVSVRAARESWRVALRPQSDQPLFCKSVFAKVADTASSLQKGPKPSQTPLGRISRQIQKSRARRRRRRSMFHTLKSKRLEDSGSVSIVYITNKKGGVPSAAAMSWGNNLTSTS